MALSKSRREYLKEYLNPLPMGFRFHPTDEELVNYLRLKIEGKEKESEVEVIQEVDVCKWEPEDLPELLKIRSSDYEWFLFCRHDRKHPTSSRSNRSTKAGFWKPTGVDRKVKSGKNLNAWKKTLVFHKGRAPNAENTIWIMHEYFIKEENDGKKGIRGGYVLCRLFNKTDENTENSNRNEIGPTASAPEATPLNQVTDSERVRMQQSNHSNYIKVRVIDEEVDPLLEEDEELKKTYENLPDLGSISPKHYGLGTSRSWVDQDCMKYSRSSRPCDSTSTYCLRKQVNELVSSVSRISVSQEEPKAKTKPEKKTEEKKDEKAKEKIEEPKNKQKSIMKFRGVDEETKQEEPKKVTKTEEKREEKKDEKAEEKKEAKPRSPVVLLVDLHCEGCAKKIKRSIKKFEGVEDVEIKMVQNQVTVKGNVDPQTLRMIIERELKKTNGRAQILSPLPAAEGEPIPEVVTSQVSGLTTVVLHVNMHSEACAQQLKREILKMRGVQTVETELSNGKVTVTGTIDGNQLVDYVYRHTKRQVQIVPQAETEKPVEKKEGEKPAEEASKPGEKKGENAEKEEEEKLTKERKEGRRENTGTRKKNDSNNGENNENNGTEEESGYGRTKKQAQIVPQPEPDKQAEKKEGQKPEEEAPKPKDKKEDSAEKKEKEKLWKKIRGGESSGTRKKDEPNKEGEENNNGETMMNYYQWDRVPRLTPAPQFLSEENPNACCIS